MCDIHTHSESQFILENKPTKAFINHINGFILSATLYLSYSLFKQGSYGNVTQPVDQIKMQQESFLDHLAEVLWIPHAYI